MENHTNPVRRFYRGSVIDLSSVTDVSLRHFRFMLRSGRFLKVRDRISSGAVLRRWLLRYSPSDVYYSASCFLSPENVGRREGSPLSTNVYLFSDIVFDIDFPQSRRNNLEKARAETLRLLAFLECEGFETKYTAFSGSKGFHVVCRDPKTYRSPDPLEREDEAIKYRKKILARVESEDIEVDGKITTDTRRIIRLPGTINSKTGYICTVLSQKELERPVKETLKYIPKVNIKHTPPIPARGDERMLRIWRKISGPVNRFGVRFGPAFSPNTEHHYATYVTSQVPGTKRHVPFFRYPRNRNPESIVEELSRLQETYNLSDTYLFRSGSGINGISLTTLDRARLLKVMKASTSTNLNALVKYGRLYFRIAEKKDHSLNVIDDPPEYLRTVEAGEKNNAGYVSRPHYTLLKSIKLPMQEYQKMHGSEELVFTHVMYTN